LRARHDKGLNKNMRYIKELKDHSGNTQSTNS